MRRPTILSLPRLMKLSWPKPVISLQSCAAPAPRILTNGDTKQTTPRRTTQTFLLLPAARRRLRGTARDCGGLHRFSLSGTLRRSPQHNTRALFLWRLGGKVTIIMTIRIIIHRCHLRTLRGRLILLHSCRRCPPRRRWIIGPRAHTAAACGWCPPRCRRHRRHEQRGRRTRRRLRRQRQPLAAEIG